MIKVKKLNPDAVLPSFAHNTDAGADLYTCEALLLEPGEKGIAKTGIAIQLPPGFCASIRPKSGMTVKGVPCLVEHWITDSALGQHVEIVEERVDVTVYLGLIDYAYRGDIGIMVKNESEHSIVIPKHTKLAQLVLEKYYQHAFVEVDELSDTDRGEGGFGSTVPRLI